MRGHRVCALFAGMLALSAIACSAQLEDAVTAHRAGKYEDAIAIYQRTLGNDPASVPARRGLARALMEVGKYGEAEQVLRAAPAASVVANVANTLGDALRAQGKLGEAQTAYRAAREGTDSLTARLNLAVLQYERGETDAALREFDTFIDVYSGRPRLSSEDLTAIATAVRYLGVTNPQLFKDALRAYDEALAADPNHDEARLRLAEMFLEKYNGEDAQNTFQELLEKTPTHPRALVGMARAREFAGAADAIDLARKAIEVNPNLVDARVYIARSALSVEDVQTALKEAEHALRVNPSSLDALTMLAAAQHFAADRAGFEATRARIAALNPKYADLYATLAELSVQNRRYAQAVELARTGVRTDSMSFRSHGILGINLMRLGQIKEGRAELEFAFKGDPFNVWFKNTLDLLDTMDRFKQTEVGRFQIAADSREADLLAPYVAALADEAYARLSERYRTQLQGPVRVELFHSHADFSVRTVGLAGLGALGASFGNVLVLDSPSAREPGQFNWGATLWHELAHAFHLALSDHRVPRWLTEGLASLEERRARPGWGDEIAPGFIQAYKEKKLLPISEINSGFVRPKYPEQVQVSYYHASLLAEMIERDHGFNAILDLLRGYREGKTTEELFRSVLKSDLAAVDRKFDAYLNERFGKQIAAVRAVKKGVELSPGDAANDYATQLIMGQRALAEKKYEEAIAHLEKAKSLFPEYAADDSPYALLARIYREKGDVKRAAAELEQLTLRNENTYEGNLALADLADQSGNTAGGAAALERAIYVYPMQPLLHTRLAAAYQKLADKQKVVRERRALVALNPVDKADAFYQLAVAYYEAGDLAGAKREVLHALEEAPNFEKAQELLLKLRGSR